MVEYLIQEETLIAIADAIRAKINGTNLINPKDMPTAIETIGSGNEKPFDCHSVTFMCGDTVLYVRSVADGDTCADPVSRGLISAPTKESTAQYNYTFYGWGASDGGAADANILKNITEDKTVYAIFTATVRYYTITWLDEDGTTVLKTEQVAYGATPSYIPTKEGAAFESWTPTPVAVTGEATYVASWSSVVAAGTCGDSAQWSLDVNYVLTISGTGAMYSYTPSDANNYNPDKETPWYSYKDSITAVIIKEGITRIGDYALRNTSLGSALVSIELPTTLTYIGIGAFYDCTKITTFNGSQDLVIPNGVTTIAKDAFAHTNPVNVYIPASATSIAPTSLGNTGYYGSITAGYWVDAGNPNYSSNANGVLFDKAQTKVIRVPPQISGEVTIPATVTYIPSNAFGYRKGITGVIFEETSGWWYASSSTATSGTAISAASLADQATAKTYLTDTYAGEHWFRS